MSMAANILAIIFVGIGSLIALSAIIGSLFMSTPTNGRRFAVQLVITTLCANIGMLIVASATMSGLEIFLTQYVDYAGPITVFAILTVATRCACSLFRQKPAKHPEPRRMNYPIPAP